jgi:hypothetical protein
VIGRRVGLALAMLASASASACTSDAERCAHASHVAVETWQAYANTLQSGIDEARAHQAESQAKLSLEIEPRLAKDAVDAASARYDRASDAFMRAYQAHQAAACDRDAACKKYKSQAIVAGHRLEDLVPRLAAVKAVMSALEGKATRAEQAKSLADAIAPESGNALLTTAKAQSDAAFEPCQKARGDQTSTR